MTIANEGKACASASLSREIKKRSIFVINQISMSNLQIPQGSKPSAWFSLRVSVTLDQINYLRLCPINMTVEILHIMEFSIEVVEITNS